MDAPLATPRSPSLKRQTTFASLKAAGGSIARAVADDGTSKLGIPVAGHWETLNSSDIDYKPPASLQELQFIDRNRKKLLAMARQLSPMKTALRLRLLPRTVKATSACNLIPPCDHGA